MCPGCLEGRVAGPHGSVAWTLPCLPCHWFLEPISIPRHSFLRLPSGTLQRGSPAIGLQGFPLEVSVSIRDSSRLGKLSAILALSTTDSIPDPVPAVQPARRLCACVQRQARGEGGVSWRLYGGRLRISDQAAPSLSSLRVETEGRGIVPRPPGSCLSLASTRRLSRFPKVYRIPLGGHRRRNARLGRGRRAFGFWCHRKGKTRRWRARLDLGRELSPGVGDEALSAALREISHQPKPCLAPPLRLCCVLAAGSGRNQAFCVFVSICLCSRKRQLPDFLFEAGGRARLKVSGRLSDLRVH